MRRKLGWTGPVLLLALVSVGADKGVKLRAMAPIYVDANGTGMRRPEGVGCGRDRIVVSDSGNGRLLSYTLDDDTLSAGRPIALPELPWPGALAINSRGEILVVDRRLHRVARLTSDGAFLGYLELDAAASPDRAIPWGVAVDGEDRIYVLDSHRGRVVVLDAAGALLRKIPLPDPRGFVADIAVDSLGVVYAIDSTDNRLLRADKGSDHFEALTAPLDAEMDFPTGIAAGEGQLFVADRNGSGVVVFGRDGSFRGRQSGMGWKEGYLRYPSDLCLDGQGDLFVADRENNRVQPFLVVR